MRTETDPSRDPVVARGRVILPAGLKLDGLEVALHTASGEELTSAEPDETGHFELRTDSYLLPGWTVATAWIGCIRPRGIRWEDLREGLPADPRRARPGAPPVDCDLVVGEAVKFHGKVTDRATGKPIEGASVQVFSGLPAWRDNSSEETTTDGEGKYQLSLEELPAEELVLCCRADDFQAEIAGPLDVPVGTTRTQDFSLAAEVTITGRVLDDATGAPLPTRRCRSAPTIILCVRTGRRRSPTRPASSRSISRMSRSSGRPCGWNVKDSRPRSWRGANATKTWRSASGRAS